MVISIREVIPGNEDAHNLAHILITANEHAFRGLVPDQCLEFTEAESATNWQSFFDEGIPEEDMMIVAGNADGEVIGYAWAGPNTGELGYDAELRQISVLPGYQGQGIGREMVRFIADYLLAQGMTTMKVNVLKVNPNRAFYERLGAELVSEQPYHWDGVELTEWSYGWMDIRILVQE